VMKKILLPIMAVSILFLSIGCSQEDAVDTWTQNIYPATNNTYDIGSPTLQYSDGYFVDIHVSNNGSFGNISTSGDIDTSGNVTASYFIGDGSQLTGLEQGELLLYFLDEASPDVAGSNRLSSIADTSEVTLTGAGLGDGSTLMGDWITDVGVPSIHLLTGNLRVHVAGIQTGGTKEAQYYFEIWKANSLGVDIELLSTSEYTIPLTNVRSSYRIWSIEEEVSFNNSDRIRILGYAYVTGGGSAPTVEAYIQGASNTRLVLPVGAVSVEKFVPYTGAVSNLDMGSHDIWCDDLIADDDIWCDVAYTRTVGINSSLYHIGDPDTFWHFNTDEIYITVDGFKVVEFLNESSTFYNNVSMESNLDVVGYIANGNASIRADGTIAPVSMADAGAINNSIYFSTDAGVLVYKDSIGVVNNLY